MRQYIEQQSLPVPPDVSTIAAEAGLGLYEATRGRLKAINRHPAAWLYSYGAVVRAGRRAELAAYPWSCSHIRYYRGRLSMVSPHVVSQDSPSLTLYHDERLDSTTIRPDASWFLDPLVVRISRVQGPRALAALRSGERLKFGAVEADSSRIWLSKGSMTWEEVHSIRLNGRMRFFLTASRSRYANAWIESHMVTDLIVFLRIAEAFGCRVIPGPERGLIDQVDPLG